MMGTTRSPQLAAGRNPKLATTRTTTVIDALSSTELGMSVLLVKVDVEGAEIHVLQALQPMLSSIENLVVETSPGWWTERHNLTREDGADLYKMLFEKHRFQLAYSSEGKWFSHAESMRRYIMQFGPSGYWSQHDIWFGRNADVMIETINRGRDQRENAHH